MSESKFTKTIESDDQGQHHESEEPGNHSKHDHEIHHHRHEIDKSKRTGKTIKKIIGNINQGKKSIDGGNKMKKIITGIAIGAALVFGFALNQYHDRAFNNADEGTFVATSHFTVFTVAVDDRFGEDFASVNGQFTKSYYGVFDTFESKFEA